MSDNVRLYEEDLKKVYDKANRILENYREHNPNDDLALAAKSESHFFEGIPEKDKFSENFHHYLKQDEDLFKILLLLLNSPFGLTKNDIASYVMADRYRTDENGATLSPDERKRKISKNLNYIEKNVAHLSSLMHMFYPSDRDTLRILKIREQTSAKAFRYKFKDYEKAVELFPHFKKLDSVVATAPVVTEKERKEIAETCFKDVVSSLNVKDKDKEKNVKDNLKAVCRAIREKRLCQIKSKYNDKVEPVFFMPVMIRDITENFFDDTENDIQPESYSKDDLLNKYLQCEFRRFVIFGLQFESDFRGNNINWYKNSKKIYFYFEPTTSIKAGTQLSEEGLKESQGYLEYTHDIYKLNPYRNLWGEDFYLLLPKIFYMSISGEIREKVFRADWIDSEKNANDYISSIDYLNPYGDVPAKPLWGDHDKERFNLDYYDPSVDYQLVKCKNYVELLDLLYNRHLVLPKETLPRELVDRQNSQFVCSLIDTDMVASPHYASQKEQLLDFRFDCLLNANYVFHKSDLVYKQSKAKEYVSKFGYSDLSPFTEDVGFYFTFCWDICRINLNGEVNETCIGIPLCISEEDYSNYIVFLEYSRMQAMQDITDEDKLNVDVLIRPEICKLNNFIFENRDNGNLFEKLSDELDMRLVCLPLSSISSISCLHRMLEDGSSVITYFYQLDDISALVLERHTEKELKPNAKLDDLTRTERDYHFYFERIEDRESMYFPDSFRDPKLFLSTDDFRKNRNLNSRVNNLLDMMDDHVKNGLRKDFCFLTFHTHKRSDVIRFLHENMGRVTYLDMSEDKSDPLRIFEELEVDYLNMIENREIVINPATKEHDS